MSREESSQEPLVIRHVYDAARERVFAAFCDAKVLERWYTPVIEQPVAVTHFDLRPGGGYRVEFGAPAGEEPYVETGTYVEIARPSRIVIDTVLTRGDEELARTHNVFEFVEQGAQTELVMTETGTPRDVFEDRRGGWSATLANLPRALAP